MTPHDILTSALGGSGPAVSPTHITLVAANLGMTVWTTTVDLTILFYTGTVAAREAWRRRTSTPSIVCIMSALVALGQLVFSGRRIGLLIIGAELSRQQPSWSVVAVMVGSGFITAALVAGMIWRASRIRPGTGRWVAGLNAGIFAACVVGGGSLAA